MTDQGAIQKHWYRDGYRRKQLVQDDRKKKKDL